MNRRLKIFAALMVAATLAALAVARSPVGTTRGQGVDQLVVQGKAIALNPADAGQERVGRLRYLGGLVLTSNDRRFGGISGLLWEPGCRRLLAASDDGYWFILEPAEHDGRLTGIATAYVASFHQPDGRKAMRKSEVDAEALARDASGQVWVFYEQNHRAERFAGLSACQPETLVTEPDRVWPLPHTGGWAMNGGAEAAAGMGAALTFLSESATTVAGARDRRGVIGQPVPGSAAQMFSYAVPAGFSPTDMDALNGDGRDGRMLVLHRRLSGFGGFAAIVAEATLPQAVAGEAALPQGEAASPQAEARVVPVEIARLAAPLSVDNMEALAIRTEGERRFIYLMSDDNYQFFQRTLLLKFELLPPSAP